MTKLRKHASVLSIGAVISVFFFAIALLPFQAWAHTTGVFFQTTVKDYIVDVGYSTAAPTEGEATLFDFQLRHAASSLANGSDVDFSDVWVRIDNASNAVVFASGIHNAEFGGSRMSYVFPKPGKYLISMRYEKNATTIVESSFPIEVLPGKASGPGLPDRYVFAAIGLVAGVLVSLLIRRKSRLGALVESTQ